MASLGHEPFDASRVDPATPRTTIPAGDYQAVIIESEEKENAKGTGTYLQLAMEVIEGQHKGAKLWSRLNLNNPSDVAVGIARAELSSICRAVGVMKPKDSSDLHNLPLIVKVGLEKRKDNGELTNVIKGYLAKDAAKSTATPPAKAPWKRS